MTISHQPLTNDDVMVQKYFSCTISLPSGTRTMNENITSTKLIKLNLSKCSTVL